MLVLINVRFDEKSNRIILVLDELIYDEIGQLAGIFIVIMRRLRNNYLYLERLFIIFNFNYVKIQVIYGMPFLKF